MYKVHKLRLQFIPRKLQRMHYGQVCALRCHDEKPFLFASGAWDNTLRVSFFLTQLTSAFQSSQYRYITIILFFRLFYDTYLSNSKVFPFTRKYCLYKFWMSQDTYLLIQLHYFQHFFFSIQGLQLFFYSSIQFNGNPNGTKIPKIISLMSRL